MVWVERTVTTTATHRGPEVCLPPTVVTTTPDLGCRTGGRKETLYVTADVRSVTTRRVTEGSVCRSPVVSVEGVGGLTLNPLPTRWVSPVQRHVGLTRGPAHRTGCPLVGGTAGSQAYTHQALTGWNPPSLVSPSPCVDTLHEHGPSACRHQSPGLSRYG